jgi:hypothetical protein
MRRHKSISSRTALSCAICLTATAAMAQASDPSSAESVPIPSAQAPSQDLSGRAASFVQSYAAATAKRQAIARWVHFICVRVVGLGNAEAAAVKARVEEVAESAGVLIQPPGCQRADIEIGFTSDPQQMLDGVIKSNGRLLGDPTSGTKSARTVTLPIQAWYETNGKNVSANAPDGLRALAAYRAGSWAGLKTPVLFQTPCCSTPSSNMAVGNYAPAGPSVPSFAGQAAPFADSSRQFLNAFVIVDQRRTASASLGQLADYVAMLALSQPQSLGSCQALPSITDLFADCPGRPVPKGLTLADTAYLHALYAAGHQKPGDHPALLADVADGMAPLLAGAKVIAR